MGKKGDTWVSTVLYIALGTVVVTMLLAAGLPVINKIRDKNIVLQTKEVMFGMNDAIRTVIREGPGSQRSVSLDINAGQLVIDDSLNKLGWNMESKAILSEPDITINEGDLAIITKKTNVVGRYNIVLSLDYNGFADIRISGDKIITGRRNFIVRNNGIDSGSGLIVVEIRTV